MDLKSEMSKLFSIACKIVLFNQRSIDMKRVDESMS